MSILSKLLRLLQSEPIPEPLPPLPEGKLRIHLLCGTFASSQAAFDYCFAAKGDLPQQITIDQPGAYIDTSFVELVVEDIPARLAEFLDQADVDKVMSRIGSANALVIITEDAFDDTPYVLTSNDTLHYIGPMIVAG